jgi:hypothetical protein
LKKLLFIAFVFVQINIVMAQNLVNNSSFEKLDSCLYYTNTINSAKPWDTLQAGGGGGLDLFNVCSYAKYTIVPNTKIGFRDAKTGNGFIESAVFVNSTTGKLNYREYVQAPLNSSLQNGKIYTVTFFVSRPSACPYAIDRIGAYLDNGAISTTYGGLVNVTPQVENPRHHIIVDTVNWTKVQGCFTANGTESYLTLGNFYPDSLTDTMSVPYVPHGLVDNASFFIDDVSVLESNSIITVDNDTTITQGDTITLGKILEGMPIDWYDLQGNLLAASSTIKVSPSFTTSYVVKMDLCGNVSYDTVTVSVATGVEQLATGSSKLEVYPNPASQSLVISHQSLVNTIEVTNVLGQSCISIINYKSEIIDVEALPKGIYFLKATDTNGNTINGKFVKE